MKKMTFLSRKTMRNTSIVFSIFILAFISIPAKAMESFKKLKISSVFSTATLTSHDIEKINQYDEKGRTPLVNAIEKNDSQEVADLLAQRADPNIACSREDKRTPLKCSVGRMHTILNHLLEAKADVNKASDEEEGTALLSACDHGVEWTAYAISAQTLIATRANLNIPDMYGNTALSRAIIRDNSPICALLVEARAEVNRRSPGGEFLLHQAVSTGNPEIIRILLEAKADLKAQNTASHTAFFQAREFTKLNATQALLEYGEDFHELSILWQCAPELIIARTKYEARLQFFLNNFFKENAHYLPTSIVILILFYCYI